MLEGLRKVLRNYRAMRTIASRLAVCLLAGLPLVLMPPAEASGRFYVGLVGSAEQQDARYSKSVANNATGAVNTAHDDADREIYGLGIVGGYQWPLSADGGIYLSGEVEVLRHSGRIRGQYPGACKHDGPCTRFGDAWPESWDLEKNSSWGATLKLGLRPEFAGPDVSVYVLAGFRHMRTDFSVTYSGCFVAVSPGQECPSGSMAINETLASDRNFDAWTVGLGAEKQLDGSLALQVEARYTDYEEEAWVDRHEAVTVPIALSGREIGLSLRLLRYF